tara:strand:- start:1091 stop:2290 length:1200 start_codon:yes stop_codon:yes gene_type:complete
MKKYIIIIAAVSVFGLGSYFVLRKEEAQVKVETIQVKLGDITNVVTATGTIEPITQVDVGTQVSGTIEKIYVDYNSEVKKGQVIAELDKSSLKATLAEAQANLEEAQVDQAYNQKNYDRIKNLHENKVVSDSDYEDALYALQSAKVITRRAQIDVDRARINYEYATIYAPIDGVVLSRDVDEGQTVAASYSTPTLFTIAQDLKQMQVEADVDEADIGQVKVGQRVSFYVDAYPDELFSGYVTQVRLNPTESSSVITYTVIIKADNPENKLMPGLTANVTIYSEELTNVLTIGMKAVSFEPDMATMGAYAQSVGLAPKGPNDNDQGPQELPEGTVVWVKNDKDIKPKSIETGSDDGVNIQVIKGLEAGEEVVYSMQLTSGGNAAGGGSSSSPFMPKPPGR